MRDECCGNLKNKRPARDASFVPLTVPLSLVVPFACWHLWILDGVKGFWSRSDPPVSTIRRNDEEQSATDFFKSRSGGCQGKPKSNSQESLLKLLATINNMQTKQLFAHQGIKNRQPIITRYRLRQKIHKKNRASTIQFSATCNNVELANCWELVPHPANQRVFLRVLARGWGYWMNYLCQHCNVQLPMPGAHEGFFSTAAGFRKNW